MKNIAAKIYIKVVLPLGLADFFTYHVVAEEAANICVGLRVSVPFGNSKVYTGIICEINVTEPELYKTKEIYHILDKTPIVSLHQLKLWKWVAEYYFCSLGLVYRNQFPAALRLDSETFIKPTSVYFEPNELSKKETMVLEWIKERQIVSIKEFESNFSKKEILPILNGLITKGLVQIDEKLVQKYKKKYQKFVTIGLHLLDKNLDNSDIFKELEKAPKQREILLKLLSLFLQENKPILLSEFIKQNNIGYATIKSLEEKNLLFITDTEVLRYEKDLNDKEELKQLSFNEKNQLNEIENKLVESDVLLIEHEVFSEKEKIIYQLIEKEILKGGKVLYLLPNVTQATIFYNQLALLFPNKVVMYHSGISINKNAEAYLGILQNKFSVVLGVRSVPFLPLDSLSLLLIEQEQEILYKQRENKPYFNAREVAIYLAHICKAKCILISLAPSIESYNNVYANKYAYLKLPSLHKKNIPKIELIDLKEAYKKKTIKGTITEVLETAIREELKKGNKVVIYQNRKGYAPILECVDCGYTPYCPNCDVSLTYYKEKNNLKCHYCGHTQEKPSNCFRCKSKDLNTQGIGIEQIEKDLKEIFPNKNIVKLSSETTKKKNYFETITEDFEEGKIDILIGTQLLLRLKSFDKVSLLGVIKIDSDLNQKSLKAHENTYQNILRLAELFPKEGLNNKILLQTTIPDHQILQNLTVFNYKEIVQNLIYERKNYLYPPYVKLIQIRLKHSKPELVDKVANQLKILLENGIKEYLLGPESPAISRIRNEYIKNILIKVLPKKSSKKIKDYIGLQINNLQKIAAYKKVKIEVDIDPFI